MKNHNLSGPLLIKPDPELAITEPSDLISNNPSEARSDIAEKNSPAGEKMYFPELDGLRFFAFLLVFISHTELFARLPYLSVLRTNGWIGVDLFFVLSAFLFTKLLLAEYKISTDINFKKFYIRRIFRIWPIYFMLVGFSIISAWMALPARVPNIGLRILGLFTFTDNIITATNGYNPMPYVVHLWTIGYEEQFYLFIPLIILLLVRSTIKTKIISLLATLILFNIFRLYLIIKHIPYPAIYVLPVTHFESIIMGIVIGFGGLDPYLKRSKPMILGIIALLFFILLYFLPTREKITFWQIATFSFAGITTSLVLYTTLISSKFRGFLSGKIFVFLGKRSYGLYIYHIVGIAATTFGVKHLHYLPLADLAKFLASLFFTILFSIISYKIIETPFLKLKKKFEIITSRPI